MSVDVLQQLVESFKKLPSIGERSAQRITYYLLQSNPSLMLELADALTQANQALHHCQSCNMFTAQAICDRCQNMKRDRSLLCVVETPADQQLIESTHGYRGLYYVLMGALHPLEGVGPQELSFERLGQRLADPDVKEVIIATNFTAEGETTAYYIAQLAKTKGLAVTRIARGIPAGGQLEYVDEGTMSWALKERRPL